MSLNCLLLCLGAEDFTPEQDVEEVRQIEKQIKRRFAIGTQVRTEPYTNSLLVIWSWRIRVLMSIHRANMHYYTARNTHNVKWLRFVFFAQKLSHRLTILILIKLNSKSTLAFCGIPCKISRNLQLNKLQGLTLYVDLSIHKL